MLYKCATPAYRTGRQQKLHSYFVAGFKKNNLTGQATNINKKLHHWKQL